MENNNYDYTGANNANQQPPFDPNANQQYYAQNPYQQQYNQPNMYQNGYPQEISEDMLPKKFKPLSAWKYFGYNLLFCIPVVGLILNLIFCFNNDNINRRNFARSFWCSVLLGVVIAIVVLVIFMTNTDFLEMLESEYYY